MLLSRYSILFDIEQNEFFIYNTLSNFLMEIDKESYSLLNIAQSSKLPIDTDKIDGELRKILIDNRIIVENDLDSFLLYKGAILNQRNDLNNFHLTLAPTMDCCFRCHYCFEKKKESKYMSNEVMCRIVNYVKQLKNQPDYHITWFGGEPLMAVNEMRTLYNLLVTEYKEPTYSNIITTGFHIDSTVIECLKSIKVSQIQITLDGLKESHNKIKFVDGCDDVFTKVLNNIELLFKESDIHVIIRVNLTKLNAQEYSQLYKSLLERFGKYQKIGIAPAFVLDRGSCEMRHKDCLFNTREIADFIIDLYEKEGIHTPQLLYPSPYFNECAIRNPLSISFDPEGYAYKCWEHIGNEEYCFGQLNNNGKLNITNLTLLNRHLYGADQLESNKCIQCTYLPICNGGCPLQRIENLYEGQSETNCSIYRYSIIQLLKFHISAKRKLYTIK